ncbi:hypothetical protein FZC66_17395 [Priestia megaterium]|nr:hypothetical protein FZC66_17395 [Priestia megaterium]
MGVIKLNHEAVTSQLKKVSNAKGAVSFSALSASDIGKNTLDITQKWQQQEQEIQQLMTEYIQMLTKSIEDTQANVDLLKQQDEAMARS